MRLGLLYNPFDIVERLALASRRRRRLLRLRGTPAAALSLGHIGSLELLEMLKDRPPSVIHDIGANTGTWTCLAKSIFPRAAIEAFEPLAVHFDRFRATTQGWSDVRLHPVALGPSDGVTTMQIASVSDASSVLPLAEDGKTTFRIAPAGKVEVRLATLDAMIASGEAAAPDLIKLDVQGFELEVLRGAEGALAGARAVLSEVSFRRFYQGQALFGDVLRHLEAKGFVLRAFGADMGLGEPLVQADALFVRDE